MICWFKVIMMANTDKITHVGRDAYLKNSLVLLWAKCKVSLPIIRVADVFWFFVFVIEKPKLAGRQAF